MHQVINDCVVQVLHPECISILTLGLMVWYHKLLYHHFESIGPGLHQPVPLVLLIGHPRHKFNELISDEFILWILFLLLFAGDVRGNEVAINVLLLDLLLIDKTDVLRELLRAEETKAGKLISS